MSDTKGGKTRKRPSARRASARSEGKKEATKKPVRAQKRVSARRGAAAANATSAKPAAKKGAVAKKAGPSKRAPATKAAPKAATSTPAQKVGAAKASGSQRSPATAKRASEAPAASTSATAVAEREMRATVAAAVSTAVEPPVDVPVLETGEPNPTLEPPGLQVGDDAWETVAEGTAAAALPLVPTAIDSSLRPAASLTRHSEVAGPRQADALGSARAVLGADYYYEQWGREGLRRHEVDVDDFGLDPHFDSQVRPWLSTLVKRYFRLEISGTENLPKGGRALLVCNRSGLVPWDGLLLKEALRTASPSLPALRWLSEDSVFHYPFLGVFMNRMGAVRACPENAERLLGKSSLVAVFPEGARGGGKLFSERHKLERFGRGGAVRLALRNEVPVLPVAIVGGEESYPMLARSKLLGALLGTRYAPITPTFPALGLLGLLPAPAKWRIRIGEPLALDGHGPEAASDALLVHRANDQIRRTLQQLVDETVKRRGSAFV